MTGFARGSVTTEALTVTVECRSVNNRYLDAASACQFEALRALEGPLREEVGHYCSRGKLEVSVRVTESQVNTGGAINPDRLQTLKVARQKSNLLFRTLPLLTSLHSCWRPA